MLCPKPYGYRRQVRFHSLETWLSYFSGLLLTSISAGGIILASTYVPAFPTPIQPQPHCLTLLREITALRITKSCHSNHDLAVLAELPKGAVLTMCGAGFNHRTATVRWRGDSYYVFEQDLPSPY